MIKLHEYAVNLDKSPDRARRLALEGRFKTASKIGGLWYIDEYEPWPEAARSGPTSTIAQRTCRQCGKQFPGGPRAWYCPDCRLEIRRKNDLRYRRAGSDRPLGSTDRCILCGKEYVVVSGGQKYCKDCSTEAVKAADRKKSLEYYTMHKETINPARNQKRREKRFPGGMRVCEMCGKKFTADGTPRSVCSDDCARLRQRIRQNERDKRRRKNKKPPLE